MNGKILFFVYDYLWRQLRIHCSIFCYRVSTLIYKYMIITVTTVLFIVTWQQLRWNPLMPGRRSPVLMNLPWRRSSNWLCCENRTKSPCPTCQLSRKLTSVSRIFKLSILWGVDWLLDTKIQSFYSNNRNSSFFNIFSYFVAC